MRKLIVTEYVTLDGVMEAPHKWHDPWWSKKIEDYKLKELLDCDTLLMGRVTYEEFAPVWPNIKDDIGYAEKMNDMRKYVVSDTPLKGEWNNSHVISTNVFEEIAKLKQQPGGDILVFGSATLVNSLEGTGVIDEYRVMIFPVIVGAGKRLFNEGTSVAALKLLDTQVFDTGVVNLTYEEDIRAK